MDNPEKRILECMRRSCLVSVDYTTLPVGTVIGKEKEKVGVEANHGKGRWDI